MTKSEEGFTLIELLLVLSIVLILSSITIPSMVNVIQEVKVQQFFNELESDVLYAQSSSLGSDDHVRIIFEETQYRVINTKSGSKLSKKYPNQLKKKNHQRITFSRSGSVKKPNSFLLSNNDTTYRIVFPLGKGRHYVERIK